MGDRNLESMSCGISFYEGHQADPEKDLGACPSFKYVWLRFDFEGGWHQKIEVKLSKPHGMAA
jgi:hypothetical protein